MFTPLLGSLVRLATLSILFSAAVQTPDPIIGAWGGTDTREGQDTEVVVIFTAEHQVAAWFDPASGEVIHTNGGLWSRTGVRVTEIVEFDSDNPERVGSSVSFDIELTDDHLSIVGSSMPRVDLFGSPTTAFL